MERMWFNAATCDEESTDKDGNIIPSGLAAIEGYHKKVVLVGGRISEDPVHDEYSHAADALRTFAEAHMRGMLEGGQIDVTLMYNSLTPDIVVGGDYRVMTTIRALANEMGIPDVPFIMYAANEEWMASHPQNAAAFAAAYRDAAEILMTDDQVWIDRAVGEMGMAPAAAEAFRDQVRADLLTHFSDTDNEALRTTFGLLLETVVSMEFTQ